MTIAATILLYIDKKIVKEYDCLTKSDYYNLCPNLCPIDRGCYILVGIRLAEFTEDGLKEYEYRVKNNKIKTLPVELSFFESIKRKSQLLQIRALMLKGMFIKK